MSEIKILLEDTRNKPGKHTLKNKYFESQGVEVIRNKLLVGDYSLPTDQSICIDSKQTIQELYSNVIQDHERFRRECDLAVKSGIKLIVLVENKDGIRKIDDLKDWHNPRMMYWFRRRKQAEKQGRPFTMKPPVKNITLVKILHTMEKEHGVTFEFTTPEESGKRILEILGGENNGK